MIFNKRRVRKQLPRRERTSEVGVAGNLKSAVPMAAMLAATLMFAMGSPTAMSAAPRGQTWDDIRKLPDWSGLWTPEGPNAKGGNLRPEIPLTPKYAALRDQHVAAATGRGGDKEIPLSNSGLCLPTGVPANMALPLSHEYLFSPGRVTILLEDSEVRRIWTDGRKHVPDDLVNPSFSGDSIGQWEGDTLVVDTTSIFTDAEFTLGLRVTEKTHVKERFTRVGDRMRVQTQVDDPELFTVPWTYTRWYVREDRAPIDYNPCTAEDRIQRSGGHLQGIDFNERGPGSAERQSTTPGDRK